MPTLTMIAAGIVIVASIAFVVIGTACRWNLASAAYGRWTRLVGVVAVLGLGAVAAWSRRADFLVAAGAGGGSVVLAAAYAFAHRKMTARVSVLLGGRDTDPAGER